MATTSTRCLSLSSPFEQPAPIDAVLADRVVVLEEVRLEAIGQFVAALVLDAVALEPLLEVVAVQIFGVHRIGRVFHALQPVARDLDEADHAVDVIPYQAVPAREQRRRERPHVREDQAGQLFHRIRRDLHLLLKEAALGFAGLIDALPGACRTSSRDTGSLSRHRSCSRTPASRCRCAQRSPTRPMRPCASSNSTRSSPNRRTG